VAYEHGALGTVVVEHPDEVVGKLNDVVINDVRWAVLATSTSGSLISEVRYLPTSPAMPSSMERSLSSMPKARRSSTR
jgi:hypothetical protein